MVETEVLKKLNINKKGSYSSKEEFVVDIEDSDEYGKIYSKLDNNPYVSLYEENCHVTADNATMYFEFEPDDDTTFILILTADFNENIYKLSIKQLK